MDGYVHMFMQPKGDQMMFVVVFVLCVCVSYGLY